MKKRRKTRRMRRRRGGMYSRKTPLPPYVKEQRVMDKAHQYQVKRTSLKREQDKLESVKDEFYLKRELGSITPEEKEKSLLVEGQLRFNQMTQDRLHKVYGMPSLDETKAQVHVGATESFIRLSHLKEQQRLAGLSRGSRGRRV